MVLQPEQGGVVHDALSAVRLRIPALEGVPGAGGAGQFAVVAAVGDIDGGFFECAAVGVKADGVRDGLPVGVKGLVGAQVHHVVGGHGRAGRGVPALKDVPGADRHGQFPVGSPVGDLFRADGNRRARAVGQERHGKGRGVRQGGIRRGVLAVVGGHAVDNAPLIDGGVIGADNMPLRCIVVQGSVDDVSLKNPVFGGGGRRRDNHKQ